MKGNYLIQEDERNFDRSDLKMICVLIAFGFLVITAIAMLFWNNRRVEHLFNSSIIKNTEIINETKICLTESSVAQRMLLNLAIVDDLKERNSLKNEWGVACKKNDDSFVILKSHYSKCSSNHIQLIEMATLNKESYFKSSSEFIALTNEGNRKNISDFLLKTLRPKYELYQANQKAIFEKANLELLHKSEVITTKSNSIAWLMLIIGLFPFAFMAFKIGYFFIEESKVKSVKF
jgi:nitrate reductase NapE component